MRHTYARLTMMTLIATLLAAAGPSWAQSAASATAASAPAAATGEDISFSVLKNSGFEQDLDGWKFSKSWSAMDDATRQQSISIRTDGPQAGRKYIRVVNHGQNGFYGLEQPMQWEANTAYTISWWSRGRGQAGQEKGANRLRIWGYGGPEYTTDFSYDTPQWTFHQYVLYSTQAGGGGVSLWTWPGDYCDIDNLVVRKAFWRTEQAAVQPGQPVRFQVEVPGQTPQQVQIEYQVLFSDGRMAVKGNLSGTTPMKNAAAFSFTPPEVGFYRFRSVARTASGTLTDTTGVTVVSPVTQMDAVRQEWARK